MAKDQILQPLIKDLLSCGLLLKYECFFKQNDKNKNHLRQNVHHFFQPIKFFQGKVYISLIICEDWYRALDSIYANSSTWKNL